MTTNAKVVRPEEQPYQRHTPTRRLNLTTKTESSGAKRNAAGKPKLSKEMLRDLAPHDASHVKGGARDKGDKMVGGWNIRQNTAAA
jgi:hypothetical protein